MDLFASLYPRLFHVAELSNWPSIQDRGLLSTSALLDLYCVAEDERVAIECARRPEAMVIEAAGFPPAVIRDQAPLSERKLERALSAGTVAEWLLELNRHVFFWPTEARLSSMLSARNYRSRSHAVLIVDTASFVEAYGGRLKLSHLNSGSTSPFAHPRGPDTFRTLPEYPLAERTKRVGRANAVAEVLVDYSVPDILAHTSEAAVFEGGERSEILWSRKRAAGEWS